MQRGERKGKSKGDKHAFRQLIRTAGVSTGRASEVRRISYLTTLPAGAGGAFAVTTFSVSGVAAATEWSSYSARFVEYRVLSLRVRGFPRYPVGAGGPPTVSGLVTIGEDRSGMIGVPGTQAAIFALLNARLLPTDKKFSVEMRATDLEDQNFTPIGSTAALYRIFVGCSNVVASAATVFYDVSVEMMVEFRGPQ